MSEPAPRQALDGWGWLLLALGVGMLANGIWMLIQPGHWYEELPVRVPDYGPLNVHFVRDIGCAFMTVGVVLIWAARRPAYRFPLTVAATLFLAAHAVLHVHDTLRGIVDSDHWWFDLPSVYLPAVVLVVACFKFAQGAPRENATREIRAREEERA